MNLTPDSISRSDNGLRIVRARNGPGKNALAMQFDAYRQKTGAKDCSEHFRQSVSQVNRYLSSAEIITPISVLSCRHLVRFASISSNYEKSECMNRETRQLLRNLDLAEDALRANLHTHCLDETARHHMERATTHVREAYIALNTPGSARSVTQLLGDIAAGERLIAFAAAKASAQVQSENH